MSEARIPGFDLIERLGAGGMASVWKARQISLDRTVAIKILYSRLAADPNEVKQFQAEAQSAAKLKHPGTVQVYDANAESGFYYFVMEYVAGYTVGDWLRRKDRLPEKEALVVVDSVADALDYAWENQKLIHCDIKPDNVMVDSDGTVKVADLGLARTMTAMQAADVSDEVMGTPAYMSPEQACGEQGLDCRTDIYSLGAMLYHMLTGRVLFEGETEDKVMEMQVGGTVSDACDEKGISAEVGWLLEKMLAKRKEDRHADWKAVRMDFARIRKGQLPVGPPLESGLSTMVRGEKRTQEGFVKARGSTSSSFHGLETGRSQSGSPLTMILLVILGLLLVAGAAGYFIVKKLQKESKTGSTVVVPPSGPVQDEPEVSDDRTKDLQAKEMYDFACEWAGRPENKKKYGEGITHFRKVEQGTRGTKYSLMAADQISRLDGERKQACRQVMEGLEKETSALVSAEKYVEAGRIYDTYAGPLASDTEKERRMKAVTLRMKQDEIEKKAREKVDRIQARMKETTKSVADKLLSLKLAGIKESLSILDIAQQDAELADYAKDLADLQSLLHEVDGAEAQVEESFRGQKGQEITVQLASGSVKLFVDGVKDGKVTAHRDMRVGTSDKTVAVGANFTLKELALAERIQRMGPDDRHATALAKGLVCLTAGSPSMSSKYFSKTHPLISEHLQEGLGSAMSAANEADAPKELITLLSLSGVSVSMPFDQAKWLASVRQKKIGAEVGLRVREAAAAYRVRFKDAAFLQDAEPILAAIEAQISAVSGQPPDKKPEVVTNAPLSREEVKRLLLDRSPGLEEWTIRMEPGDGRVARVTIYSPSIRDAGALGGLVDLKEVTLGARQYHKPDELARLSDIAWMKGLPLEKVSLIWTMVKDLGPLKGAPLRELDLTGSLVTDLRVLAGCTTLESLQLKDTPIREIATVRRLPIKRLGLSGVKLGDYSVLYGMALERLDLGNTTIRDISFLRGMPLVHINLENTKLTSFSTLSSLSSLRSLNLSGTQARDISFLRGIALTSLEMDNNPVADISTLRGMPLTSLSINTTMVKDLTPLKDMPLTHLQARSTPVTDLTPLSGVPLVNLNVSRSTVASLDPVARCPITHLNVSHSKISDFGPIRTMPLVYLDCRGCPMQLRWLTGTKIENLEIDLQDGQGVEQLVQMMPNLRTVNGLAVPERGAPPEIKHPPRVDRPLWEDRKDRKW